MKSKMIQPWRRFAGIIQAVIIVGLPFLKINGESALRFDIPTLRLHFFGTSIWMDEFFIVLIGIIFLTSLSVFVTFMFGRVWCGWLCPQTVIIDLTRFVDRMWSKGLLYRAGVFLLILLISALVAANLIWYFVSPYEFIPQVMKGALGNVSAWFWIVLTGIIFLNFLLLRHRFCATVCPYSNLQSVIFDDKTLVISFDPRRKEECMNCMACVRACPVGIDIRESLSPACINCAECVDTCARIMEQRQKKSLIGYFFGIPGGTGGLLRQNAVMLGSITMVCLVFFVYLLMTRIVVDMTVLPNYSFPPRMTADGNVINSYILSLKNRGRTDVELSIEAKPSNGSAEIVPEKVAVGPGEMKKTPVYVSVRNSGKSTMIKDIGISIHSGGPDRVSVTKRVHFMYPEE
jgi:cytochrome c oxidase accessory protein FixG